MWFHKLFCCVINHKFDSNDMTLYKNIWKSTISRRSTLFNFLISVILLILLLQCYSQFFRYFAATS
uniref:Putative ovule protein n=1 Tax=Solanum chacoense TaxID=4108 RepID=A0A0V0GV57_SOLCH